MNIWMAETLCVNSRHLEPCRPLLQLMVVVLLGVITEI